MLLAGWRRPLRSAFALARSFSNAVTPEEMVETRKSATREPPLSLEAAVANLSAITSPRGPPVSHKHAAVLVPLFESQDGNIHVILTQRSSKMSTHAGEVCLPGGKREDGVDIDDVATALREAQEELGIDPGCVSVVSTLPPVLSKHLLSVTPVVATVPAGLALTPNPAEVARVFSAPLDMFLDPGPGYSFRDVEWEGLAYRLHYWDYLYRGKTFTIWGLTAGMLVLVAEKAFGRPAGFDVHPPGAQPYTALAYEKGRLIFRGAGGAPSSAAVEGAVVTQAEAEAAVGGSGDGLQGLEELRLEGLGKRDIGTVAGTAAGTASWSTLAKHTTAAYL